MTAGTVRVFLPCTGLGREHRGFEAFTRECAAALRNRADVALTVFGGGALVDGERTVWNLSRRSGAARLIGAALGRDPYFVEQATFFAGFLPAVLSRQPDVIYFGDVNLGNALWHWRRRVGGRFRLLFYNGGPSTRPFTRCDLVQQVSPEHLDSALARGERRDRQVLLPHGLSIVPQPPAVSDDDRAAIRLRFGLPAGTPLVLSVGALNVSHKRMDYVIREVATMPAQPYLLLLGAETPETAHVRMLAARALGARAVVATVLREDVLAAYRAADAFVLASLTEGFGLAQLEALAAGLPCVAHDTPTARYVLGEHGRFTDLRMPGALAGALGQALAAPVNDATRRARHGWAYDRFSWDRLAARYAELLVACARGGVPSFASEAP